MGAGAKVVQALLIAFNFVFVLIGLAGIIAGAIIRVRYDDYLNLTSKNIGSAPILLIVLGGIIFIVAFFGCCGAIQKSAVMLTVYVILLVILLIIEIAAAIVAYVFKGKLKGYITDGMNKAFDNYDKSGKYKEAFDTVQRDLDCCGVKNYSEWKTSLPASCCDKPVVNGTCPESDIHKKGCVDALYDYLEDHLAIIGGMAVGVAVIQILGIIFACVVRRDIKEGYNYV